jgi:RNA polymerase sigma-70 factor (ECF subfamily)
MNQRAVVEAVLQGDTTRFGDIVRSLDAPVRRVVSRRLRGGQGLEEVVQEVWCRAYQRLASLLDVRSAEAWIAAIARNCVADHFRQRRRLDRLQPMVDEPASKETSTWVWDLVEQLEPQLRELLVWRYRQQLGYAEIAARLRVPASTVRGRLYEARNALRRAIERREQER